MNKKDENNNSTVLIKNILEELRTNKKTTASKIVEPNPELAATISKLISPARTDRTVDLFDGKKGFYNINTGKLSEISSNIRNRISDSENALQLFPDIELAIQILVCSILSPKNVVNVDLLYKNPTNIIPSSAGTKMCSIIKDHLENRYKVLDILEKSIRDMLFNTGSYITAVVPESSVDEIINSGIGVSTETLENKLSTLYDKKGNIKNLGILGSPTSPVVRRSQSSLEEMFNINIPAINSYNSKITFNDTDDSGLERAFSEYYDVVDNFEILKQPLINETINKARMSKILKNKLGLESYVNNSVTNMLYKSGQMGTDELVFFKDARSTYRKTVGSPLVMNWPSESIVVLHVPGDETKHVGYLGLVDEDGYPVSMNSPGSNLNSAYSSLSNNQQSLSNVNNGNMLSSMLITKAKKNLQDTSAMPGLDNLAALYNSIVEKDLKNRIKNGVLKGDIDLDTTTEVFRIMLARALSNKFTRLVYLPKELVTYFAFKYHSNGVGKSYLDDLRVMTSIRAMLLFSRVMAKIKSSINITTVNMTLDPNDPDPLKTIEIAMHDIAKVRQQSMPLGLNNPNDLVEWITKAGIEFTFEGHPGLPQTKLDFDTRSIQHIEPDNELDDLLRKQSYMSMGCSPEQIDNAYSGQFATTDLLSNVLSCKRISNLQRIYVRHLTDYFRKIILNDGEIISELKRIVLSNEQLILKTATDNEKEIYNNNRDLYISIVVNKFVNNFTVELPKPDLDSMESQIVSFDQYIEVLDKAIPAYINSEFLNSDIAGEISSNVDTIISTIKYYYIRKWLSNNGFLPELNDIVSLDSESNKPMLDIYEENMNHMEAIIRSCGKYIKSMLPVKKSSDKRLEEMNNSYDSDTSTNNFTSDNNPSGDSELDTNFDENSDISSEEELGFDEDAPGDDEGLGVDFNP